MFSKYLLTSLVIITGLMMSACQPEATPTEEATSVLEENNSLNVETEALAVEENNQVITLAEVNQHNTADDCWMAIEGQVYDMTQFITEQKHPGGAAILQGCGTDATEIFNNRPKDNSPHSDQARTLLPEFLEGTLAE